MPLSQYAGKALLVVNTASLCGFTPQYQGLQALYERYGDRGLVVIGAPSNDFGGQEPKSEGEIKEFCQGAFGVTFPLTEKISVTGLTGASVLSVGARDRRREARPALELSQIFDLGGRQAGRRFQHPGQTAGAGSDRRHRRAARRREDQLDTHGPNRAR